MSTGKNAGQVRGPVQLTFSRSQDPILPLEHSITRVAVATPAEAAKQEGETRTMGRKATIPYGLYRCHGFISAALARQTKFTSEDLDLLWEAFGKMFEEDRSAARGLMSSRGLFIFKHESALGNAPAHALFGRVTARLKDLSQPPRSFGDYEILVDRENMPLGITLLEK
jgi:CRISPR-associated protein Csd2